MAEQRWYVRVRGKVMGPFGFEQMKSLRNRRQLCGFHEISIDKIAWSPASSLRELFLEEKAEPNDPHRPVPVVDRKPVNGGPVIGTPKSEWYYLDRRQKEVGPVSQENLLTLLEKGEIGEETQVWREGMANWTDLASPETGIAAPIVAFPVRARRGEPMNMLALLALISGIVLPLLALISGIVWLGGLGSIPAIVLGLLALRQIRQSKGRQRGKELAQAGLILGCTFLVLTPIVGLLYFKTGLFSSVEITRLSRSATPEAITETYRNRVYTIQAGKSLGSGILVANNRTRGLIATNMHVIDKEIEADPEFKLRATTYAIPKEVSVTVKSPTQLNTKGARFAAFHRNFDLALLIIEVEANKAGAVPILKKRSLKQGEPAVTLGNPLGREFFTTHGLISSTGGEGGYIWTTCPISSGNSGGPLFLTRHGLLAGINTGISQPRDGIAQNLNVSIPAEEIVLSLKARHPDNWVWASDLKEVTLELADLIPLED